MELIVYVEPFSPSVPFETHGFSHPFTEPRRSSHVATVWADAAVPVAVPVPTNVVVPVTGVVAPVAAGVSWNARALSAMSDGITWETSISNPEKETSPCHAEASRLSDSWAWACKVAYSERSLICAWIPAFVASWVSISAFTDERRWFCRR